MQPIIKRLFDIVFSVSILVVFFWLILLVWLIAIIDTSTNGIFTQIRIGQYGKKFKIYKLRTIQINQNLQGIQISKMGKLLRKYKLDELPQFINVLKGDMSIVGPRPDIPGYYDLLEGENLIILELKPGLTCLASLKYYNEDALLEKEANSLAYNDQVVFPNKIKMNLNYYHHQSFYTDLKIIIATCKFMFKIK